MFPICLLLLIPHIIFANTLDSLLADNRVRAGTQAGELYSPLDKPDTTVLCANKLEDYRFLLANLPLADLALMSSTDLIENINLARQAKQTLPWGCSYSQEFFRHFVLPHRVSQEPFVHYRKQFLEEIAPRVKDLSMGEAILEVNHWCHEKATYRPTDGRDQDPLTTIRSGFGRCEEEMILTISALRSVGIPARQCYTPYWAHSDDNHAWVEAWADGKWYYLGACEPAQELNQAWFSGPAQRAMLVISTAYGDYEGMENGKWKMEQADHPATPGSDRNEQVLRRYGRSTLINSTSVYGPTKELAVKVVDNKGKPVPDCRVIFSLWNYGTLMPATSVITDSNGNAKLICGIGDWFASASSPTLAGGAGGGVKSDPIDDDILFWVTGLPKSLRNRIAAWFMDDPAPLMAFAHVNGSETEVTLKLDAKTPAGWVTELEYTPPVVPGTKALEVISAEGEARGITSTPPTPPSIEGGDRDSLFRARLAWEDSVREANVWSQWQNSAERSPFKNLQWGDTTCWTNDTAMVTYYRKARGNWGNLYRCIHPQYPYKRDGSSQQLAADAYMKQHQGQWRESSFLEFLSTLGEKDLRDQFIGSTFFTCYFQYVLGEDFGPAKATRYDFETRPVYTDNINSFFFKLDSTEKKVYKDYVIAPRIDFEPSTQNARGDLLAFMLTNPNLAAKETLLLRWLRNSITLESSPDRLGPPLTPAQCLELRRGTEGDVERLYIGLCRVRGIPARRNPVTGQVERWEMEDGKGKMEPGWVTVQVIDKKEESGKRKEVKGSLTLTLANQLPDTSNPPPLYLKDWAVARWEDNMADAMDFGWHEPFEKIRWPQELPTGWYLISSGRRREDGSAAVKLKWLEVKKGITNYE